MKNFTIIAVIILFNACEKKKSVPADVKEEVVRPEVVYDRNVTMRAQYETHGRILTNDPISVTEEITYADGKRVKEKMIRSSAGMSFQVTQDFDNQERLIYLVSEQNGHQQVKEISKYTVDGLLLSEERYDNDNGKFVKTLFEYDYPKDRPNPMIYYRKNNGKKVTKITLTKSENQEVIEERAIGVKGYTGVKTITKIKNKNGKIIEERTTRFTSDWDMKKIDTIVEAPIFYQYDAAGRIIRQESASTTLGLNGVIENFYSKQGILEKKVITSPNQPKQIIVYKKV
jgi:hypothetical protein